MLKDEFGTPEGWQWYNGGTSHNGFANGFAMVHIFWTNEDKIINREHGDGLAKKFENLFSWADENDLELRKYVEHTVILTLFGIAVRLPVADYVIVEKKSDPSVAAQGYEVLSRDPKICGKCEAENSNRSLMCEECDTIFYCSCCARRRDAAWLENVTQTDYPESYCASCGVSCQCGRYMSGRFPSCSICEPRFHCRNCRIDEIGEGRTIPAISNEYVYCGGCVNRYCESCENFSGNLSPNEDGDMRCQRCLFLGEDGDKEIWDENSNMAGTELTIPSLEGREFVRKCGVEIEGGGSDIAGHEIARLLYSEQLSDYDSMQGWHRGSGFARVETDSSVDWELVIGPVDMDNVESVRKLNAAVRIVKSQIKAGSAKLDLRCGTHIHVAADKISLGQAYNLHIIYAHIEDVMYRLGSAHWPIHRSIIQTSDGHEYCSIAPKQNTRTKFARTFHGEDQRYYGLSFHNYFEAMLGNCRCGATRYGAFEECECSLGKCTFEFRLFNATANTIKLHAYLALCQSLVAKAISMPEIKNPEELRTNNFVSKRYRDMADVEKKAAVEMWDEGLKFISELPMTPKEKKSVLYCIENSELRKVNNSIKELFTLQEGE